MVVIQIPIEPPDREDEMTNLIEQRASTLQTDEFMRMATKYGEHLAGCSGDLVKATGKPYGSDVVALLAASTAFTFGYALAQLHQEGVVDAIPEDADSQSV